MSQDGDNGEDRTYARITIAIVFLMFGVPPGLCSAYYTPLLLASLLKPAGSDQTGTGIVAVLWLIGVAVAGALFWVLVRTWRTGR
jgi:hypothetical protein